MTVYTKFWIRKHWTGLCSSKSQDQQQRRKRVSNACKWQHSYLNTNQKCLSLKKSLGLYPTLGFRLDNTV